MLLKLDVLLFSDEDARYNRDADVLAQFLYQIKERYPQITINQYDADKFAQLSGKLNLESKARKYPVFVLNGEFIVCDGIPTIEDIDKIIEKYL